MNDTTAVVELMNKILEDKRQRIEKLEIALEEILDHLERPGQPAFREIRDIASAALKKEK